MEGTDRKKHRIYRHKHVCFFRAVNFVGKLFCGLRCLAPKLSLSSVIKRAERRAGKKLDDEPLTKDGTTDEREKALELAMLKQFKEPAAILFSDLEEASKKFTCLGRTLMTLYHERIVMNRIRVLTYIREHYAQLQQVKIVKPIFVVGVPRTGTTILLNYLAADPNNRYLPLWQGFAPTVPEKQVRREISVQFWITNWIMPHLKAVHEFEIEKAEEDMLLLDFTGVCIMNVVLADIPNYHKYIFSDKVDWDAIYRFHKFCFQIIQSRYPTKRVVDGKEIDEEKQWVLKAPIHLGFLGPLLKTYPDARIIWTHRDLSESVVSMCSLTQHFRSIYATEVDNTEVGQLCLNTIKTLVDSAVKFREEYKGTRFYDQQFTDIVKDPIGSVKKIYEFCELPWTSETEKALQQSIAKHPRKKHGEHKYIPEDYDLTREQIDEVFQEYHARYVPSKKKKEVSGTA